MATRKAKAPRLQRPCPGKARRHDERPTEPCLAYHRFWTVDTAGECIDWSIPCPSIFDRKKPLADATMRRIAAGLVKFVLTNPKPYLIANNTNNAPRDIDEPLGTITTGNRHFLAAPVLVQVNHGRDLDRSRSLDRPMPTVTAKHGFGLVTPWFVRIGNSEREGQKWRTEDVDAPLGTIAGVRG